MPVLVLDGNKDSISVEDVHKDFSKAIEKAIGENPLAFPAEAQSPKRFAKCRAEETPIAASTCRPRALFADGNDTPSS